MSLRPDEWDRLERLEALMADGWCPCRSSSGDASWMAEKLRAESEENQRLRAEILALEDREAQALDLAARNIETYEDAATVRDRLKVALAGTPENVRAVGTVIEDIEGVGPWDDVAQAILSSLRARAGLVDP